MVYADVWASMGQEGEASKRERIFSKYQVDAELLAKAKPDAIFMHCLPAHRGEEVTDEDWAVRPRPGLYAVSTHLLIRGECYAETRGVKTDWLSRYRPEGRVGYSFYLFRFPQ